MCGRMDLTVHEVEKSGSGTPVPLVLSGSSAGKPCLAAGGLCCSKDGASCSRQRPLWVGRVIKIRNFTQHTRWRQGRLVSAADAVVMAAAAAPEARVGGAGETIEDLLNGSGQWSPYTAVVIYDGRDKGAIAVYRSAREFVILTKGR